MKEQNEQEGFKKWTDAAESIGRSVRTLRRWRKDGLLKKVNGRIRPEDLQRCLEDYRSKKRKRQKVGRGEVEELQVEVLSAITALTNAAVKLEQILDR